MFEGNTLELQHIRMLCERVKCTQEPLPRYIVAFAARIPGSILTSGESLFTVAVPCGNLTRFSKLKCYLTMLPKNAGLR